MWVIEKSQLVGPTPNQKSCFKIWSTSCLYTMLQTTFYLWNSHVITNLLEFLHFNPSPTTSVTSTEQHLQSSSRAGVGHCFTILTVFCIIMLNNYCFFVGMYECYLKVKVSSNKTNDIVTVAQLLHIYTATCTRPASTETLVTVTSTSVCVSLNNTNIGLAASSICVDHIDLCKIDSNFSCLK